MRGDLEPWSDCCSVPFDTDHGICSACGEHCEAIED
jgi:hypothetical protein